uniref:Uncharacterized protein n=1 Tax=Anopheles culicifacies TaxID=139723 RepID=A0A182MAH0_9DIPT
MDEKWERNFFHNFTVRYPCSASRTNHADGDGGRGVRVRMLQWMPSDPPVTCTQPPVSSSPSGWSVRRLFMLHSRQVAWGNISTNSITKFDCGQNRLFQSQTHTLTQRTDTHKRGTTRNLPKLAIYGHAISVALFLCFIFIPAPIGKALRTGNVRESTLML